MFRKLFFVFISLLFFFNFLFANEEKIQNRIQLESEIEEISLGKKIYIWEDPTRQLDINQVVQKIDRFQISHQEIPNFGYTESYYWIYFEIENVSNFKEKILLELSYPLLDIVDYYLFKDNRLIQTVRTGDLRKFASRELKHRNFIFPLELEPNVVYKIFFKIGSQGSIQIPLRLVSYQKFIEEEHLEQYIQGIYYGIMIVMILYNFFLYLSIRDSTYLYYILYIFGIMLFSLIFSGYAFEFLWPNYPEWGNVILPITIGFLAFFAGIFAINFLRMKELTPLMYKILFVLNLIFLLIIPLSLLIAYQYIIKIATYSVLPFSLIALMGSFRSYIKGWKPARFYLIAWLMVLIGMFVLALKQLGKLPTNFFTNYSLQIGSALEVILLSLGLADRINVLKKEKETAQKEVLETKTIMLESFSRFVPNHFINILQKESVLDVKPGDSTEKNITVLFNDIKGFTTLAEMMSVKETFEFLNTYFEIMNPIIVKYSGFIDKFIGDEIMALFDGETDMPLDASIEMRRSIENFNRKIHDLNLPYVDMGIGINYGKIMLGTVGSRDRLDTTVVGDTVNIAARIQQLTRIYKTPILLTEEAEKNIRNREKYYLRKLQKVRIKGKIEIVQIYECFNSDKEEMIEKKLKTLSRYEEALLLLSEKKYIDSYKLLKEIQKENPEDKVIEIYINKLEKTI